MQLFYLAVLVILLINKNSLYANNTPLAIKNVNTLKFSGLWYEIARTYNSFEKNCVAPTVEYKYIDSNTYKIINRCFEKEIGNKLIIYNGIAKALEKSSMSKLEKTYYWFFSKKYKIVYLNSYKTAIMTSYDLDNIWIIHRKPFLEQKELNTILNFLASYIDTSKLIFSKQDTNGRYK